MIDYVDTLIAQTKVSVVGEVELPITLHDRPLKTELGEYYYLIECAGCSYDSYQELSKTEGFSFRFLGCFDVE